MSKSDTTFKYDCVETKINGGKKTTRKVRIRSGKGTKSITYKKGGKTKKIMKPLKKREMSMIKKGRFVKGLFDDCKYKDCKKKK